MNKLTLLSLRKLLKIPIEQTTQIPYEGVHFEAQRFLDAEPYFKILKRFVHRWLRLSLGGQHSLRTSKLPDNARILWIYNEKLNFGDAIMDLSGRALLKNSNVQVDLLTHPKLAALFGEDDIFQNVFTDPTVCKSIEYDFILLSEFNYKSIKTKIKYFKKLPFACLYGYFIGPDRNQIEFSFAAINDIFKLNLSPNLLTNVAKPYLHNHSNSEFIKNDQVLDRPYITICTGGIDANRTYNHWLKVLQIIDTSRELNLINHVVLLGSDNGLITAQKIQTTEFKQLKITSLVNQLSILNNRAVIAGSELYIGADGGLMHVAHTTQTPTISLFSAQERPYLRLTPACHSTGVQSSGDVSLIKADHLTDLIKEHFYKINA